MLSADIYNQISTSKDIIVADKYRQYKKKHAQMRLWFGALGSVDIAERTLG